MAEQVIKNPLIPCDACNGTGIANDYNHAEYVAYIESTEKCDKYHGNREL